MRNKSVKIKLVIIKLVKIKLVKLIIFIQIYKKKTIAIYACFIDI